MLKPVGEKVELYDTTVLSPKSGVEDNRKTRSLPHNFLHAQIHLQACQEAISFGFKGDMCTISHEQQLHRGNPALVC